MNVEKINKTLNNPRILVAPLDWGLGHATRCIPIIQFLLKQGVTVLVAAEGAVANLLREECGACTFIPLKGYGIRWKHGNFPLIRLLGQAFKGWKTDKRREKWLDRTIHEYKIDAVISDNRFGLVSLKVPTVIITHQLAIKSGYSWLDKLAQAINYRFLNRFHECWVPDADAMESLAGELSHPQKMPRVTVKYLGVLSRFAKKDTAKDIDLLIVLSGPEPQRSVFEALLIGQVGQIGWKDRFRPWPSGEHKRTCH